MLNLHASSDNDNLHKVSECDRWVVDWTSLDEASMNEFARTVEEKLSNVAVPYDIACCSGNDCHVHGDAINAYYEEIIDCIKNASRSTIAKQVHDRSKRIIPGWTEFVEERHALLGDVYSIWALLGKHRQGYIYSQLRIARCQFNYALRFCLKNEKELRAKALADKFAGNPHSIATFWKEVRKLNSDPPLAQSVGGVTGNANIADMWKNHFADILNSVSNDTSRDVVLNEPNNSDTGTTTTAFSVREVLDSMHELSSGRSAGCDELNAEHFKAAGVPCATHLSLCFSMGGGHRFCTPPPLFVKGDIETYC